MRFLVDECTGSAVARWLQTQGHDAYSVYDNARGMDDESVLRKAYSEHRILITNDKDFGEKVYRERQPHCGIILLRLGDERAASKFNAVRRLLEQYSEQLDGRFIVVDDRRVRFAPA